MTDVSKSPTNKATSIRRHFELTTQADEQLHVLQEMTGAASLSEVVRRALSAYKLIVEHQVAGKDHEIILRSGSHERCFKLVF